MSKRSWQEANLPSPRSIPGAKQSGSSVSPHSYHSPIQQTSPKKSRNSFDEPQPIAKAPPKPQRTNSTTNGIPAESSKLPGISRKVKACAACRKQKVGSLMMPENPKYKLPHRLTCLIDQMYHGRRSTLSKVQRARIVMSPEQEPTDTHV